MAGQQDNNNNVRAEDIQNQRITLREMAANENAQLLEGLQLLLWHERRMLIISLRERLALFQRGYAVIIHSTLL